MFVFICGSSESGKSLYAEKRLSDFESEKKIYIAASKILDDEMRARVEKHKLMRKDKNFITIECEKNLCSIVKNISENSSVLIESLTAWLANEMFDSDNEKENPLNVIKERIFADFMKIKSQCKNIILVSDYIFSDGVTYDASTEEYIKTLAELTIKFADLADEVIECVSGLAFSHHADKQTDYKSTRPHS